MSKNRLNILTRTAGRRNYFRRCRESILAQKCGLEIRHIVSIDRPCDYLEGVDVIVPAYGRSAPQPPPDQVHHRKAPYNLYVNDLLSAVGDGWILILDDDDELLTANALAELEPHLAESSLTVCRFLLGKRLIPTYFGKELVINDVPCSSIIYHSKHKRFAEWHGRYSGDFFSASKLAARLDIDWADALVAGTQEGPNVGSAVDRSYSPWKPRELKPHVAAPIALSIIIPVMNKSGYTRAILENIREATHVDHEVIVIDNASNDDTPEVLKSSGARVIRNERNVGVYAAWNQGLRAARGAYIAILNNDLLLPDGWAETLMSHDEHAICPLYRQGEAAHTAFKGRNATLRKRGRRVRGAGDPGSFPRGFAGFCFMISREAFEATGYFDERFRYWYGDNDYYIRLIEMGFRPVQSLNAEIHHFHSQTISECSDFIPVREAEREKFLEKWAHKGE